MRILILLLTLAWFVFVAANFSRISLFLAVFIIFAALERFYETLIAAKQNILDKTAKFDWLFNTLAFCYILLLFGVIFEYLSIPKMINYVFTSLGISAFFFALALRLWAIKSLGGRWETLVLGENKKEAGSPGLIKNGPYKYVRHPIYLGAIIESLSIPLAFNSYFTLVVVILVYLPLIVFRASLEEKKSVKIFGGDYLEYISGVPRFFPFKRGKK